MAPLEQVLLRITAPLSGTVVYVNMRPGEVTDPETLTPLVEVVDLNRLVVAANIPSSQLPDVKLDQPVEIIPQQSGSTTFSTRPKPLPTLRPLP